MMVLTVVVVAVFKTTIQLGNAYGALCHTQCAVNHCCLKLQPDQLPLHTDVTQTMLSCLRALLQLMQVMPCASVTKLLMLCIGVAVSSMMFGTTLLMFMVMLIIWETNIFLATAFLLFFGFIDMVYTSGTRCLCLDCGMETWFHTFTKQCMMYYVCLLLRVRCISTDDTALMLRAGCNAIACSVRCIL